jgi:hypothetical protein
VINRIFTHIAIFTAVILFTIVLTVSFSPFALSFSMTQLKLNNPYQNPNTHQYQSSYPYQYSSQNPDPYQYQGQQFTFDQQSVNQSTADPTPVQIQTSPYQNPSSPYQNPSSPYQNPSSPYQNPSSPYQNPSSPYQNPSSPYQNQQQTPSVATNTSSIRSSNQQLPTLIVVTQVNGTGGNTASQANLSQVVANAYNNPDGYTYSYHFMRGSQIGVTLNLQPGAFAVYEPTNNIVLSSHLYNTTYSGDCANVKSTISSAAGTSSVYGYGTINLGESKTCIVTNSFQKK